MLRPCDLSTCSLLDAGDAEPAVAVAATAPGAARRDPDDGRRHDGEANNAVNAAG